MCERDVYISKTLSWLLRHAAVKEGLDIRHDGYVPIDSILSHRKLRDCSVEDIKRVVNENSKQRFALCSSENGELLIRASQGHSLECVNDLNLTPILKSEVQEVIHGTYRRNWGSIKVNGLNRMKRLHIHFASGLPTDNNVISGMRTSCNIYIYIDLDKALKSGLKFFLSSNGVILSPGDSTGTIGSQYFLKVIDVKTNRRLIF